MISRPFRRSGNANICPDNSWRCAYSSSYRVSLVPTAVDSLDACVYMLNRSACILSKLDPDGRPSESLVNVILYRRCAIDTVCAGAWRPVLSVLSRGQSVNQDCIRIESYSLLSKCLSLIVTANNPGPWGFADFRRPTSGRLVLDQGTHHSFMSNLAAQCLEFGHGVEGAL